MFGTLLVYCYILQKDPMKTHNKAILNVSRKKRGVSQLRRYTAFKAHGEEHAGSSTTDY